MGERETGESHARVRLALPQRPEPAVPADLLGGQEHECERTLESAQPLHCVPTSAGRSDTWHTAACHSAGPGSAVFTAPPSTRKASRCGDPGAGIPAVPQGPAVLFLAFQAEGSVGGGEVTAEREPGSRRAGCLAVCTALTCTFSFNSQDVHTRDELRPPLHRAGRGAGKPSRSHEPPSSVSDWKSRIKVYIFLSFSSHQIVISGGPKNV